MILRPSTCKNLAQISAKLLWMETVRVDAKLVFGIVQSQALYGCVSEDHAKRVILKLDFTHCTIIGESTFVCDTVRLSFRPVAIFLIVVASEITLEDEVSPLVFGRFGHSHQQ
ncbi:hypothetical protein Pmi06nite_49170 [Planotetraspora mira]|uniref:Uncharacterized protein n=1 Tax=Planotetraspora mira TaxID=58121 RepID=A0A8J3X898_9ACTN|nr:hypothetical protein Pmi06nite_49170 [Planotetraspora mira]